MSTLVLRLAGPMQSWGDSSRFSRRMTRHEPTKSGVLGLLAAAQGRRRTDPIEELAATRFGVRIDQRGRLQRDFQTARTLDGKESMPLSHRYYLTDAVFVAAVEGPDDLMEGLAEAVQRPTFPLYLGRRSCPPSQPVFVALQHTSLDEALRTTPWQAADWYCRQQGDPVSLELVVDAPEGKPGEETVRDVPVSYDPRHRDYGWRDVTRLEPVFHANPGGRAGHDPFSALGGA